MRSFLRPNALTLLLASGLAACGAGSSLDEYEDGVPSVVPSPVRASDIDGGADDEGTIGASCTSNKQCEGDGTECLTGVPILTFNLTFPKGYCTQGCQNGAQCPAGSGCYMTAQSCLKTCTNSTECRVADGYSCAAPPLAGTGSPKFCLPSDVAGLIGGLGGLLAGGSTAGGSTSGGGTTGGFLAGLGGLLGGGGTGGSTSGGGTTGGFLAGLGGLLGGGGGGSPGGTGN